MVGMPGFEPGASASRTLRANQAALHPVRRGESSPRRFQPSVGTVAAARSRVDGAAQGARVDRLHELGVGVGPLGEEAVGLAVEQQQDRRVGQAPAPSLEPQVDRAPRCRPCWRSACRARRGRASCSATASRTSWPRVTSTTCWPGPDERGPSPGRAPTRRRRRRGSWSSAGNASRDGRRRRRRGSRRPRASAAKSWTSWREVRARTRPPRVADALLAAPSSSARSRSAISLKSARFS